MEELTSKLTNNTLISGAGRALGIVVTLLSTAFLTRALGSENFGVYSFIISFTATFYVIADFGFGQLLAREIAKDGPIAERRATVGALFGLRLTFLLVSLGVVAPLAALAMGYTPFVIKAVIIGGVAYLFMSLGQLLMGIFQWALRMQYVALSELGARLLQLAAVCWAYTTARNSVMLFLAIFALGFFFQFVLLFISAERVAPIRPAGGYKRWWALMNEALPIGVSLILIYIYFRADSIILALYHPGSPVGFYNLAYKVLENLIFFPAMFVGLVFPKLSAAWPAREDDFRLLFRRTLNVLLVISPLVLIATFLLAPLFTHVLGGPEFAPAAASLKILSLAIAIIFLATLPSQAVIAMGIQKRAVWLYLAGAVLNVALNLAFIPRYSYIATSWNTVITEVVVTVGLYWMVHKEMRNSKS